MENIDVKLFTRKDCPKCNYLKPFLTDKVQVYDVETVEGLSELVLQGLVDIAVKQLPIMTVDGNILIGSVPIKRFLLRGILWEYM